MHTKDLSAEVATADKYDVLVDTYGAIWVRFGFNDESVWSYLSSLTELSWDQRDVLPTAYEPYRPLDTYAAELVVRGLRYSNARTHQGLV